MVNALAPGSGWLSLEAVARGEWGRSPLGSVRAEAGVSVSKWLGVYGYGDMGTARYEAGVGARVVW